MKTIQLLSALLFSTVTAVSIAACSSSSTTTSTQCGVGGFACSGNKAYTCQANGTWKVTDCSATIGTTCTLANTGASCQPLVPDAGSAQCGAGGFTCANNTAYNCGANGTWMTTDCSTVAGSTCVLANTGASCAALPAPSADCAAGGFSCVDTKAYNCGADGKWQVTDCAAQAGTVCGMTNQGASCQALTP